MREQFKANISVEQLEERDCPSVNVVYNGTQINVRVADTNITHQVSVDNVVVNGVNKLQVTEDGNKYLFDPSKITFIDIEGALNNPNIIQNNTSIQCKLRGGNKVDEIFGGSGINAINPLDGNDVVYAILPSSTNTIRTYGNSNSSSQTYGRDVVFTNIGAKVESDSSDLVARFFAAYRLPGSGFIGQETDGVLYITPTNNGSYVRLDGNNQKLTATVDLGDGKGLRTLTFTNVKLISYFGGTGNDVYINNTNVSEAAYGSTGNDNITGGKGDVSLLKGSGGNDTLTARAKQNSVSGNAGSDTIYAKNGVKDILHVDNLDKVFADGFDILVTP